MINDISTFGLLGGTPDGSPHEALEAQHLKNVDLLVHRFPQFERTEIQELYDQVRAPLSEAKIHGYVPTLAFRKARELLKEKENSAE